MMHRESPASEQNNISCSPSDSFICTLIIRYKIELNILNSTGKLENSTAAMYTTPVHSCLLKCAGMSSALEQSPKAQPDSNTKIRQTKLSTIWTD